MNGKTLTLAVLALTIPALAASVSIQLVNGSFQVTGVAPAEPQAGWQSIFAVYTAPGDVPPMLGTYRATREGLVFAPRFPLAPGVHYRALYKGVSPPVEQIFDGPERAAAPPTRIQQVYPTADVLPSNQLKFYIHFSAAMQRGGVWQHIRLLDDAGKKIDLAFLELDQELWDPANRRLTVLLDPGRIKRGVKPQMETGSAIVEGRHYTLMIDAGLHDANGAPLAEAFRKTFAGGPSIRTGIDLKDWKITPPARDSRSALTIDFPRPLDFALLEHVIRVRGPAGDIEGAVSIGANETRWLFTPSRPWIPGPYTLVIDMALEDLAGNRVGRPFDVDLLHAPAARITATSASLPFYIHE